ncbi:Uncharacterised protein [Mycobacteroides abscessus subsp. abscessus]|nr:Uncharacterised protein [Mycobacteroides abscessus subsp. abscessus]
MVSPSTRSIEGLIHTAGVWPCNPGVAAVSVVPMKPTVPQSTPRSLFAVTPRTTGSVSGDGSGSRGAWVIAAESVVRMRHPILCAARRYVPSGCLTSRSASISAICRPGRTALARTRLSPKPIGPRISVVTRVNSCVGFGAHRRRLRINRPAGGPPCWMSEAHTLRVADVGEKYSKSSASSSVFGMSSTRS